MHPSQVACMQSVMIRSLFPAPDVALSADRTNPSPWSLSVKHPSKTISGLVIRTIN